MGDRRVAARPPDGAESSWQSAHVLPTLDPPARLLIDANLDLERMADIVVECAQSLAPSDFDHDEGDVLTDATSGARANALVFRVLLLRAFELILADPAYERVLRASVEPSSSDIGRIPESDQPEDRPEQRGESHRADLRPPPQPLVPPGSTGSSMSPDHEYQPIGQPSGAAVLRRAIQRAGMRGRQSDRTEHEHQRQQPPREREQQAWPPTSSSDARPRAQPERDYDKEDPNVELDIRVARRAIRQVGMRGGQSDRTEHEYRRQQPPSEREQQAWPPPSSGGARPHARPEQDYDKEDLNVELDIGASRSYRLPDAKGLAAVTTVAGTMRPELAAPPSEAEAPRPSDRSSIRSPSRWLIVILIFGAALAAWIYREEVGAVAAALSTGFAPPTSRLATRTSSGTSAAKGSTSDRRHPQRSSVIIPAVWWIGKETFAVDRRITRSC